MKTWTLFTVLLLTTLVSGVVIAQDNGEPPPTWFQSREFNVPIPDGWEDKSTADIAQFYLAEAEATVRATIVQATDAKSAAAMEIAAVINLEAGEPIFSEKVNLADGTWTLLVYHINVINSASVMVRQDDGRAVVISFIETDPSAQTIMLTLPQSDETLEVATPEIVFAIETLSDASQGDVAQRDGVDLPSGDWEVYAGRGLLAMGMVFGNDSYVALQQGRLGNLPALTDAYNRMLLGFFITTDTTGYLVLGLAAVAAILGALVLSFAWRSRGIQKDLEMLRALAPEDG